jgi:hypothetical protein
VAGVAVEAAVVPVVVEAEGVPVVVEAEGVLAVEALRAETRALLNSLS